MSTDMEGFTWILDTEANSIRTMQGGGPVTEWAIIPEGYLEDIPGDIYHYRNWPGFLASEVVQNYIDQLRSLETFPCRPITLLGILGQWPPKAASSIICRRLLGEYCWPDDFRAEDWARDFDRVWEEAEEEERQNPVVWQLDIILQRLNQGRTDFPSFPNHPWANWSDECYHEIDYTEFKIKYTAEGWALMIPSISGALF